MSGQSVGLLCLLLLVSTVASAQETKAIPDLEYTKESLRLLADAANLRSLSSNGSDEIRVWTENYMGGTANGYIIREDGIKQCKTRFYYNNKKERMEVRGMRCVREFSQQKAEEVFNFLDQLVLFNGKSIDCGVFDGWGATIEGVRFHHVFVIEAGNPNECNIPGSKEIVALVKRLWK